ncbi:MAG: hypothetical protein RR768_02935 [Clostridium sp.]
MKKKAAYILPVILGILFCFYYLHLAADNVAYTDYIRLINSYLPDVYNPAKFFVPDILTRVPITYLGRMINVELFGYNTLFDMALGVLSLGAGAAVAAVYAKQEKKISYLWFLLILFVYYSLNKWEMLTNGTGWVCFLSISGFYCHYLALDHAIKTHHSHVKDRVILLVLPSLLTLFTAGPYCGSYSAILTLIYLVMLGTDFRKTHKINHLYAAYLLAVLLPLGLYLWSNSSAVYVHRGAVAEGSLPHTFISDPLFFVRFMLKSLASSVLGMAQIMDLKNAGSWLGQDRTICILGLAVMCMYLYALFLTVRYKIYKKTVFPLFLMLNGGLNHLLIVSARWIFMNDSYGMSPRYMLQYQMGILGILFTFAIVWGICHTKKSGTSRGRTFDLWAVGLGTALILMGNVYTTKAELQTAPYRKAYLEVSRNIALNYKTATDEELETYLHSSADAVRSAMKILEENHLNLFSGQ